MPVFFASRHLLLKWSDRAKSAGNDHRQSAPPWRLVNARQLTGPRRLLRLLVSSREPKSPALDSKFQTNQKTNGEPITEHLAERPAFCSKLFPSTLYALCMTFRASFWKSRQETATAPKRSILRLLIFTQCLILLVKIAVSLGVLEWW